MNRSPPRIQNMSKPRRASIERSRGVATTTGLNLAGAASAIATLIGAIVSNVACESRSEYGSSNSPGNGDQALPEGRSKHARFPGKYGGEDDTVEQADGGDVEDAFLQNAKVQPPGEIADRIEIIQPHDLEAGIEQLSFEFRPPVTAKVAKVFVDGCVNFRARGHEETEVAVLLGEQAAIVAQLTFVGLNVFEHIHANDCVPAALGTDRVRRPLDQRHVRQAFAKAVQECAVGFHTHDFLNARLRTHHFGDLADPGADFEDVAGQDRREFFNERGAIILRFAERRELEVCSRLARTVGLPVFHRSKLYLIMHHNARTPSFQLIFFPSA